MKNEIISSKQGISLIITLIIGSTLVISGGGSAKQDEWISVLIAMAMALPIIFIYGRLTKLYPNKSLYDISEEVLGKIAGKIINLIFTWYFFHLGALVFRNITEFIQVVSFQETPQLFVGLFIGILIIYTVKCGIEVLGRLIEFMLPFFILFFFFTIILALPKMEINHIKPILYNGWKPVLNGSFSYFGYPFIEIVIFIVLFKSLDEKDRNPYKIYLIGLLIGGGIIILAIIRNILILGTPTISHLYFPSYTAVTVISVGDFIHSIEVIVSITMLVSCYTKISICLLTTCMGISKLFNLDDYKQITAPTTFLMLFLSFILYNSTMEMFDFLKYYTYYELSSYVILPLIIWIVAEIKGKNKVIN